MVNEPLERRQNSPVARSFTFLGVLLILAVVSLAGMGLMLIRINSIVDEAKVNSDYLIECTTPGKNPPPYTGNKCFDDSQIRLGNAIDQIITAVRRVAP